MPSRWAGVAWKWRWSTCQGPAIVSHATGTRVDEWSQIYFILRRCWVVQVSVPNFYQGWVLGTGFHSLIFLGN